MSSAGEYHLTEVAGEIKGALCGRHVGRLFPLSKNAFALDFHPHAGVYLLVDLTRGTQAVYLIARKLRFLEKRSVHPAPFMIAVSKALAGAKLGSVRANSDALELELTSTEGTSVSLVLQLKPRPGAMVQTADGAILAETGVYLDRRKMTFTSVTSRGDAAISQKLDAIRQELEREREFKALVSQISASIKKDIEKRRRLRSNLASDLERHGDPGKWKRYADLILANLYDADWSRDVIDVKDVFEPEEPTIQIAVDKDLSPSENAENYYKRYAKARNAVKAIAERSAIVDKEIAQLSERLAHVERLARSGDVEGLQAITDPEPLRRDRQNEKRASTTAKIKGVRRFLSSDGFEILVGKKAVDNDNLTFRISKSLDTWLHAADYPGSHVIIRNPYRKLIPQNTLIEAASIAAFYSDARGQGKAGVKHTLRKFVNKPRRSAPGLVSLSTHKTILVEPGVPTTVKRFDD